MGEGYSALGDLRGESKYSDCFRGSLAGVFLRASLDPKYQLFIKLTSWYAFWKAYLFIFSCISSYTTIVFSALSIV